MDDKWFKAQQKKAGVTAGEIAERMGRDRSTISHIYTGRIRMSLDWAKVFAEMLNVPLSEVLEKAGVTDGVTAQQFKPGFAESDAAPWVPKAEPGPPRSTRESIIASSLGGGRPGVDVWVVKSRAMALAGYLPGDFFLVDTHQAERVAPGDAVIAQIYSRGGATTVLRRFQPPVLLACSADPDDGKVFVVDGENVVIRGKVIASWRM